MDFQQLYMQALALVIVMMTFLWAVSVLLKNASIVDVFWGAGFVILTGFYLISAGNYNFRTILLAALITIWGLRLSVHLFIRNYRKGEDFRYRNFRKHYGERRYWWVSFFQVFLLQGILMWLISITLAATFYSSSAISLGWLDVAGIVLWGIGFFFEVVGDYQLRKFKMNPANKGKVMDTGLWRYTRHPNYFGDAAVWWGYAFFCLAAGNLWQIVGAALMTFLIIRVSGVAMLERTLTETKPGYREYARLTSAFIPWFRRSE